MCITIEVKDVGLLVKLCGELRKIIGQELPIKSIVGIVPGYVFHDDECLCHVDIEAAARWSGYTCKNGWTTKGGFTDWIWSKPTA